MSEHAPVPFDKNNRPMPKTIEEVVRIECLCGDEECMWNKALEQNMQLGADAVVKIIKTFEEGTRS